MSRRFVAANKVLPRTIPQPGYGHFLTPLRKVVVDYDPYAQHQGGIRWVGGLTLHCCGHADRIALVSGSSLDSAYIQRLDKGAILKQCKIKSRSRVCLATVTQRKVGRLKGSIW